MKYRKIEGQIRDGYERRECFGAPVFVEDLAIDKRYVQYVVNLLRDLCFDDLANELEKVWIAIGEIMIDWESED